MNLPHWLRSAGLYLTAVASLHSAHAGSRIAQAKHASVNRVHHPRTFAYRRRKITEVSFVVAGVQKAGTTALHGFLAKHPEIALPRDQALHFFDTDKHFIGEPDYRILHENFRAKRGWRVAGETTSGYVYWPTAMERIARYDAKMKIIVSLRNPVDRAFSHWNMRCKTGQESLDFLDAVKRDENVPAGFVENERQHPYLERGRYVPQIERIFRHFPREQVLVIKYEDFRRDYAKTVAEVFDFIGVERLRDLQNEERNVGGYHRKVTDDERLYVTRLFADDIWELERLLGWDCADWLRAVT